MDYETKATSRKELRLYARLFRTICGFTPNEPINPIEFDAMVDNISPCQIICFGNPFPEMDGNITVVDYMKSRKVVR